MTNTGGSRINIQQAALTGAGFAISGLSLPLGLVAGQSSSFNVIFQPGSAGPVTGSLLLSANGSNAQLNVPLSGTGTSLSLSLNPSTKDFGQVVVGSSASAVATLTNTGTDTLTVSQANVAGRAFSISGLTVPVSIPSSHSVTFTVIFTPTGGGNTTGSVAVVSNASNSPATESLSGTGIHTVTLSWQPSSSSAGGYNVYRGTVSGGPYMRVNSAAIMATTLQDSSVQAGQTYYYVATSIDANNNESPYSNQAAALVPSP